MVLSWRPQWWSMKIRHCSVLGRLACTTHTSSCAHGSSCLVLICLCLFSFPSPYVMKSWRKPGLVRLWTYVMTREVTVDSELLKYVIKNCLPNSCILHMKRQDTWLLKNLNFVQIERYLKFLFLGYITQRHWCFTDTTPTEQFILIFNQADTLMAV